MFSATVPCASARAVTVRPRASAASVRTRRTQVTTPLRPRLNRRRCTNLLLRLGGAPEGYRRRTVEASRTGASLAPRVPTIVQGTIYAPDPRSADRRPATGSRGLRRAGPLGLRGEVLSGAAPPRPCALW